MSLIFATSLAIVCFILLVCVVFLQRAVDRRLGLVGWWLELWQIGRMLHGHGHVGGGVAPPAGAVRLGLRLTRQVHAATRHARVVDGIVLDAVGVGLACF